MLNSDGLASEKDTCEINTADIEKKRDICKRAKQIAEAEDLTDGALKLSNLFEEWKAIRNNRTEIENQLWEEFQGYRAQYRAARENLKDKNRVLKEEIIAKADVLMEIENFKEASAKLNELMDAWKSVRSAGREMDEKLWAQFSEKRKAFQKRKTEFFQQQQDQRDSNQKQKEALIEEAKCIASSQIDDWKKASDDMNALMEQWKKIGFAGNEVNDKLWEDFNAARNTFYEKRQVIYAEKDAEYMEVAKVKKELIERAKEIAALEDYSAENTALMKELDAKWKEAGSAGRNMENDLWIQFRDAKEAFWEKKHQIADEKRKQWAQKAQDIINKKKQQRDNLQKQIADLNKSINNSTNVERILTVREWIDQKQKIIEEISKEIKDIEKRM